jgi:hypothetical protein
MLCVRDAQGKRVQEVSTDSVPFTEVVPKNVGKMTRATWASGEAMCIYVYTSAFNDAFRLSAVC